MLFLSSKRRKISPPLPSRPVLFDWLHHQIHHLLFPTRRHLRRTVVVVVVIVIVALCHEYEGIGHSSAAVTGYASWQMEHSLSLSLSLSFPLMMRVSSLLRFSPAAPKAICELFPFPPLSLTASHAAAEVAIRRRQNRQFKFCGRFFTAPPSRRPRVPSQIMALASAVPAMAP